jgi:hypothetical protein
MSRSTAYSPTAARVFGPTIPSTLTLYPRSLSICWRPNGLPQFGPVPTVATPVVPHLVLNGTETTGSTAPSVAAKVDGTALRET